MARVNVVVVDGPRALEARSTRTELKRASGVILTDLAAERNALNNAVTVDLELEVLFATNCGDIGTNTGKIMLWIS